MPRGIRDDAWTQHEVDFLLSNFGEMHPSEIAQALGRSEQAIRCKSWNIGCRSKKRRWSGSEDAYLRGNFEIVSPAEMAVTLGRPIDAIRNRMFTLGLNVEKARRETAIRAGGRACTTCSEFKPFNAFYKNPKGIAGRLSKCVECSKAIVRERKYGLPLDAYREMWASQGGLCAICEEPLDGGKIVIDHDHACCDGENTCGNCVRGIVHSQCNCGLGFFNDDLTKLRKAVKYLEKYAGVTN